MNGRSNGSEGPEDVDAAFAEIIADLEREGLGAGLMDLHDLPETRPDDLTPPSGSPSAGGSSTAGGSSPSTPSSSSPASPTSSASGEPPAKPDEPTDPGWRTADAEWDWASASEEEHYVPPEPPPMPRLRAGTIFGLVLIVIGILLLVIPGLIGLAPRIGTPLALVSLAAGIGWLVLRMRHGPPPDSGWDDGAQL